LQLAKLYTFLAWVISTTVYPTQQVSTTELFQQCFSLKLAFFLPCTHRCFATH